MKTALIEKLKIELEELSIKLEKLLKFLVSEDYKNLDYEEKTLLRVQKNSMLMYKEALQDRINYYSNKKMKR